MTFGSWIKKIGEKVRTFARDFNMDSNMDGVKHYQSQKRFLF